jgi:hypothetical protein
MTKLPIDNNVKSAFANLKTYMDTYRAKLGKKTEEFKVTPVSEQQTVAVKKEVVMTGNKEDALRTAK